MENTAKNWWKRSAGWVIGLRNKPAPNLFTVARIKITFWYALIGLVILGVGAYLVYAYIIYIIGDIIRIIQALLGSGVPVSQTAGTTLITQSINGDLAKMSIAVGVWIIFTMVLAGYVLAEIILIPLRRAMEREHRFIADVAHELKTPLAVMRTNADVALMNPDATIEELAATIRSNREEVDRMVKITQFLMNFSSLERRMAKTKLVRVDLAAIAADAVKSMEPVAAKKGVLLHFATSAKPALVAGNATALGELATNLLKNAVAYTPAGGSVAVSIMKRGSFSPDTVLSVADTGVGIPPEDLPNIFETFYRGRNATKEGGGANSGLGLAIVREIAALHRAVVSARSEVGEGTVISVRFPSFS